MSDAKISLIEMLLTAFLALVTYVTQRAESAKALGQHEKEVLSAVTPAAQRIKDKFLAAIIAAREANSPGGATVTLEEMSEARRLSLTTLYESLSPPALKYAKGKGEDFLKAHLGGAFSKILTDAGVKVVAAPVAPPQG